MKCFSCGAGTMKARSARVEADVRGEKYMVDVEAEVCDRCGEVVFDDAQADAYTIAGSDAYRRAHGLLTTAELRAARERLGLSQKAFADRLKVGIASVKRWELGAIQDESSDRLIRLSTNADDARRNLREIEALTDPTYGGKPALVPLTPPTSSEWTALKTLSSRITSASKPRRATALSTSSLEETHAA